MVPAQQRLQPDNAARTQLDLRLVVKFELVALDRAAQLVGDDHAFLDLAIEVGAVEAEAVAAVLLGAIEREIGLDHHGIGPGDVGRVARYPDADRDMDFVALDDIGLGQDFSDLGRQRACRRQILGAALQDRELVAAEARHDVGLADCIADAGLRPAAAAHRRWRGRAYR